MYQDVIGHRETGRKNARSGTVTRLGGRVDPKTLMGELIDDINATPGATANIPKGTVGHSISKTAQQSIKEFEPPEIDVSGKKVSEAVETVSNTLTKSLMKNPSLGKNLAIGALSVAAGLLVSGYASGNPLNDPDPATIDQKGYEGVQAAPEMMFSSGQGFAPNNTGGYIINIKGDTRKGNRQLKKALRQATKNATGSGNINMSVKTTQSSGVYSDRDIENILNNYF